MDSSMSQEKDDSTPEIEKFHMIMLTNGDTVEATGKQFFCWSVSEKEVELWDEEAGLPKLIKTWRRKTILLLG